MVCCTYVICPLIGESKKLRQSRDVLWRKRALGAVSHLRILTTNNETLGDNRGGNG